MAAIVVSLADKKMSIEAYNTTWNFSPREIDRKLRPGKWFWMSLDIFFNDNGSRSEWRVWGSVHNHIIRQNGKKLADLPFFPGQPLDRMDILISGSESGSNPVYLNPSFKSFSDVEVVDLQYLAGTVLESKAVPISYKRDDVTNRARSYMLESPCYIVVK